MRGQFRDVGKAGITAQLPPQLDSRWPGLRRRSGASAASIDMASRLSVLHLRERPTRDPLRRSGDEVEGEDLVASRRSPARTELGRRCNCAQGLLVDVGSNTPTLRPAGSASTSSTRTRSAAMAIRVKVFRQLNRQETQLARRKDPLSIA
jgi:hypothetical protein